MEFEDSNPVSGKDILFKDVNSDRQTVSTFHNLRRRNIQEENTPVDLDTEKFLLIHIVPCQSFASPDLVNIQDVETRIDALKPIDKRSGYETYNSEGLARIDSSNQTTSYVQLFRCGVIEAVTGSLFYEKNGKELISGKRMEKGLVEAIGRFLKFYENKEIEYPFYIQASLVGAEGVEIYYDSMMRTESDIKEDMVSRYNIKVEERQELPLKLKPIFDSIWNSAGLESSVFFEEDDWKFDDSEN
jgi:hypothetical protein